MTFEWDAAKNAKIMAERGTSFEQLEVSLAENGILDQLPGTRLGQLLWVIRHRGDLWVLVVEPRSRVVRFVTAYRSRKLRKKYG